MTAMAAEANAGGADDAAQDCVFCKIGRGEIPVQAIYEDEEFIAFPDLHKVAPLHALVVPRRHYATLLDVADEGILGRAILAAGEVARRLGIADEGFRTVINTREDGGQTVYHLHIHVMGGRFMQWPPG